MRLLICGSRDWTNGRAILEIVMLLQPTLIIEGGARGADRLAQGVAMNNNISWQTFPADWNRFGKAAGYIRNRMMLFQGHPDLVVAFSENIVESKGTSNMLTLAEDARVPYALVEGDYPRAIGEVVFV